MRQVDAGVALPQVEVLMVEQEFVRQMRVLRDAGWGAKSIARELGVSRNTVRRYVRSGSAIEVQVRPLARCLDAVERIKAAALLEGAAEGNAVVIHELLTKGGSTASLRTVQRAVASKRREIRAADLATVRFETAPGQQMQIDFGQKLVRIAGVLVRVHLLVAVLGFSRRIFVRAFLTERQDDWREGIAAAFRHFGGVPSVVLGDNARALVLEHNRSAGTVIFHPGYVAFCKDWDVRPRACGPYRARTKGKTESGVKYAKRNALAGREFTSFAALEAHLSSWMTDADRRMHGTTHERPIDRFERERAALRPLPVRALPSRDQRLKRRVANDALVDIDTIRYSVPHGLVRERVEVLVAEHEVHVFHGGARVAVHRRSREPHSQVVDHEHWKGLWRVRVDEQHAEAVDCRGLEALGQSLSEYAAVVAGGVS